MKSWFLRTIDTNSTLILGVILSCIIFFSICFGVSLLMFPSNMRGRVISTLESQRMEYLAEIKNVEERLNLRIDKLDIKINKEMWGGYDAI